MTTLSENEAYAAMFAFLEHRYGMTASGDLAALLGSMSLLPDGSPADPAIWRDWQNAIRSAKEGSVEIQIHLR